MTGSGTIGDPYIIWNATDLQNMELDLAAYYELGQDIDASATSGWNGGLGFEPVGQYYEDPAIWTHHYFTGQLDGNGYTISNLTINMTTTGITGWRKVGLFGETSNATVRNVKMTDVMILTNWGQPGAFGNIAGLVADSDNASIIEDCEVHGTVTASIYMIGVGLVVGSSSTSTEMHRLISSGSITGGHSNIGGVVGIYQNTHGDILDDCYSSVDISSNGYDVGGIVGQGRNLIHNCHSTGNISGNYSVGGVVGRAYTLTLSDSSSMGDIVGDTRVGGVCGLLSHSSQDISKCHSEGDVTGNYDVGGVIGYIYVDYNAGSPYEADIWQCYALGDITGKDRVGGIIGAVAAGWDAVGEGRSDINIYDSYARGKIETTETVVYGMGGAIGCNGYIDGDLWFGGDIDRCYSTGLIVGTGINIGGFCGQNDNLGTITGCFWDKDTSGIDTSAGGTGKTTSEMKNVATFPTWNFTTIWAFSEITTQAATDITATTATLNGLLDFSVYNDLYPILQWYAPLSDCTFQWGETIAYGNETAAQQKITGQSFSQAIGGLVVGTTYHFRTHAAGSDVYGDDMSFGILVSRGYVLMDPIYGLILQGR